VERYKADRKNEVLVANERPEINVSSPSLLISSNSLADSKEDDSRCIFTFP